MSFCLVLGLDYVRIRVESERTPAEFILKLDSYQKRMLEFDLFKLKPDISGQREQEVQTNIEQDQNDSFSLESVSPKGSPSSRNVFMMGNKIRVEIFRGNLIKQQVDVIVNAANGRLILGGKQIYILYIIFKENQRGI